MHKEGEINETQVKAVWARETMTAEGKKTKTEKWKDPQGENLQRMGYTYRTQTKENDNLKHKY